MKFNINGSYVPANKYTAMVKFFGIRNTDGEDIVMYWELRNEKGEIFNLIQKEPREIDKESCYYEFLHDQNRLQNKTTFSDEFYDKFRFSYVSMKKETVIVTVEDIEGYRCENTIIKSKITKIEPKYDENGERLEKRFHGLTAEPYIRPGEYFAVIDSITDTEDECSITWQIFNGLDVWDSYEFKHYIPKNISEGYWLYDYLCSEGTIPENGTDFDLKTLLGEKHFSITIQFDANADGSKVLVITDVLRYI
jgi:hypothetical protein